MSRPKLTAFFSTTSLLFLITAMFIYPEATYQGALSGLKLWFTILVPSLFPFLIIAEIMFNLGLIKALGLLLEPLMRPLFNLPGSASFVLAMGFTSGFPMGTILTKRLYETNKCTLNEAERLIAFTNNASPLFLLVAVAIGMFEEPALGWLLLLSHYMANLLLGIILGRLSPPSPPEKPGPLLSQSLKALLQPHKPWGQLCSEAIQKGIQSLSLIGGFVIIYAVLLNLLQTTNLLTLLQFPCTLLLKIGHLDPTLDLALVTGLGEMTLGLQKLAQTSAPLPQKAIIASFLLGWSGLSIHSQVHGLLGSSKIKTKLYTQGRIIQSLLACLICALLLKGNWFARPTLTLPPLKDPSFSLLFNFLYLFRLFYLAMGSLFFLACLSLCFNYKKK